MSKFAIIGGALALAFYLIGGASVADSASNLVSKRQQQIEQALGQ